MDAAFTCLYNEKAADLLAEYPDWPPHIRARLAYEAAYIEWFDAMPEDAAYIADFKRVNGDYKFIHYRSSEQA